MKFYKNNIGHTPNQNKILMDIGDDYYLVVGYTCLQELYDFSEEYEPVGTVEEYLPHETKSFKPMDVEEVLESIDDSPFHMLISHMRTTKMNSL